MEARPRDPRDGAWEWPSLRFGRFDEGWLLRLSGPALALVVLAGLTVSALTVAWVDLATTAAGFWPPAGVTFVTMLLLPPRRWGWVVLAATAISAITFAISDYPLATAVIWLVGNMVEPIVGASLLRGDRRRTDMRLQRVVGRFVLYGVIAGPAVGGAIGAIGSAHAHGTAWAREWIEWMVGDGLGILIVVPLILAGSPTVVRPRSNWAVFVVGVAAVSVLSFTELGPGNGATVPYLIFVLLVAAAMRFGVRAVAAAAFVIAESVNIATALDRGPFSPTVDGADTALSLQVFLAIAVVTSFIIGALVSDLAGRDEVQELLTEQATHDALTGLPNRVQFNQRLEEAREDMRATGRPFGVVLIDLDQFKKVNDRFGHPTGDEVLLTVAAVFDRVRRPDDLLARLGGDEFVLLCRNARGPALAAIADEMLAALAGTHQIGNLRLQITASAGVADARDPDDSAVEVMRRADVALYRSKRGGGFPVTLFDEALEAQTRRRAELEDELRGAVWRGELRLEYQPIVHVRSGRIAHFEALLRWDSRIAGAVPPDEFIPLAEEIGAIASIGEWVLSTACAQAAAWSRQRGIDVQVAVNVSARQLADRGFAATVTGALAAARLQPESLMIEITETAMMDDLAASRHVLTQLGALGVRLALDDFGTGYSSMAYLRGLPLDCLKIDRSFLAGLAEAHEDVAIVEAVVHLGRSFGLDVIAEGVETAEQQTRLIELGCSLGQGYLWYRPLRPDVVGELPASAFAASAAQASVPVPGAVTRIPR